MEQCECCGDTQLCCFACFCPCLAYKEGSFQIYAILGTNVGVQEGMEIIECNAPYSVVALWHAPHPLTHSSACWSKHPFCVDLSHCFLITHLYITAAENMGGEGWMYCLATFPFGLGCCSLTFLGKTAADKRGIKIGLAGSACRACCDPCCCYSCTVVNESRIIKLKEAGQLTELMKRWINEWRTRKWMNEWMQAESIWK